ncbi:MAG: response regulator [Rhodanobacteraceae bacterium]
MDSTDDLSGCRVLVVEDDAMLSMLLQDLLTEMGCVIAGSASRFEDASHKCGALEFDVALLDINLRGERTLSIAETMLERHQPFILATGYGVTMLPESLRAAPMLQKPYRKQDLECALWDALHNG